jgi:PAS domain S-box-containing protein
MTDNSSTQGKPFNPWHFIWITVVVSELFTALMNTLQHYVSPEADLRYLLKVGAIDSLFVPLIVAPVIIYFLQRTTALTKINAQLEHEIAERKRAEEAQQKSEQQLRVITDTVPAYIAFVGLDDLRYKFVNSKFEQGFGIPRNDIIGKHIKDIIGEKNYHFALKYIDEVRSSGRQTSYENIFSLADGKRWISVTYVPTYDNQRKMVGLIVMSLDISERKWAEEKLQVSEQQLRESQRVAEIGHYALDIPAGAWTNSEELDDIFGIGPEYVRSVEGWLSIVHPAEQAGMAKYFTEQVLRDHVPFNRQYRIVRKSDGAVRWVHGLGNLTLSSDGKPISMFGTIQDITERKIAEEALRENQVRLDLALHAAHMGVWRWEIEENKRYFDELTCQLLGIDAATFTGAAEEFFKVVHPDDREKVKSSLARAIEQDGPYELTYRVVWPEGSIHYIASRGRLEHDDHRQPVRFNGIVWDITEQYLFESALLEKERRYRSLFESANDGIFINSETGFVDCNQKGAEMYGLTREELIGRLPTELSPERQPDGRLSSDVAGEKMQVVLSGIPQIFEWQSLRADGSSFDVEITLNRLELGGKMYVQAVVRDINERKRLEQEHLKSQKLESIGMLAGGIAHDFNNLLQGVFGYISLAKLRSDDHEKSRAALEEAEKALHMSVKLTNQLLTFSKGGMPVKKTIDLPPVIENAVKFALSGSRTDYRIVVDDGLWHADADEGQIGQVIQNIVLNADQAMPVGGKVQITARNVQAPGPSLPQGLKRGKYIEIAIMDTGIGISEQYVGNIFDPYFTTKEKGSGLGLATSYSIIKNHNGVIDVRSEVDKGTTFFIYLPATEAIKAAVQDPPAPAAIAGRTGRVLVMDDEQVIRNVAKALIGELGHRVKLAAHGNQAIEKYETAKRSGDPFDIVILDLTIRGGMGGAETLQRLLKIDPTMKAIASSGYSDDAGVAGYQKQGFKSFLKKPYNIDELRDVLTRLLNS